MFLMTMAAAAALLCAEGKPDGLTVSTWVREDIFAGFLAGELPQFEKGMEKLEAILAANPRAGDALAWRAGGRVYLAVRALEAGDRAGFDKLFAQAQADFAQAPKVAAPDEMGAVLAVKGGTFAILADRLPAGLRREGWTAVRDNYGALREAQKAVFDRLPLHMRGEVLAGLAQAEQRLNGESGAALAELMKTLPESVYAKRAQRWQEKPELAAKSSLTCQTCHEAGRLAPVLARQKKQ